MPTCFKNQCDHEVRMILAFLPHAISLFLVICFELLITRAFFLESSSYRWSTVFPDLLAGCFGPSCPKKRHPCYVRNESVYICTRTHTDASTAVPMLKTLTCGRKEYDCMCLQTQTYSLWTQVNGEASSEVKTVLVNKLN